MTASHSALRGSAPGQNLAFDDAVAHVGCPDRWSSGAALGAVRPPNRYVTTNVRSDRLPMAALAGDEILALQCRRLSNVQCHCMRHALIR